MSLLDDSLRNFTVTKMTDEMPKLQLQDLRKELKQWESAFYVVNRRKPEKNDIAEAHQDIKDKYQLYFQMKKTSGTGNERVILPDSQMCSPVVTEVWGPELNKKPKKSPVNEASKKLSGAPNASLDKMGAKLFQNFSKSPMSGNIKKARGIFKRPEEVEIPQAEDSSLSVQRSNAGSQKNILETHEVSPEKLKSCHTTQEEIEHDDFVIKGDLFKGAEKLFAKKTQRAGDPSQTYSITSKPRLSFLSRKQLDITQQVGCGKDEHDHSGAEKNSTVNQALIQSSDFIKSRDNNNPELVDQRDEDVMKSNKTFKSSSIPCNTGSPCDLESLNSNGQQDIPCKTSFFHDSASGPKGSVANVKHTVKEVVYNHSSRTLSSQSETSDAFESLRKPSSPNKSELFLNDSPSQKGSGKAMKVQRTRMRKNNLTETFTAVSNSSFSDAFSFMEEDDIPLNSTPLADSKQKTAKASRSSKKKPAREKTTNNSLAPEEEAALNNTDDQEVPAGGPKLKGNLEFVKQKRKYEDLDDTVASDGSFYEEEKDIVTEQSAAVEAKVPPKKAVTSRKRSGASLNDNFVCLNMKRKGYRRKGAGMTGGQLRKKQWKAKMAARSQSFGSNKCFKCGQEGHWANKCKGKSKFTKEPEPNPADCMAVDESEFPSLRQAVMMSRGIKDNPSQPEDGESSNDITDIEATIVREQWNCETRLVQRPSLSSQVEDLKEEMRKGLSVFGFSSFRPGQEDSIERILQGLSTLVVLSTGGGKSLCYQLPAYLYHKHQGAVTLVISPLVSLMEDQITGLPPGIRGACLHSSMTPSQRDSVISDLREGKVHFLLVSPEAIVERGGVSQGSFPQPGQLPPIAFACIDEAHCLSEWSHNFRPSYLRLCKVLKERYNVHCFLGLTATATKSTARDVTKHLGLVDDSATVRGATVPPNLVLSVSRDCNKDEALVNLLRGERFKSCESIIIYCSRREQTNRVATLIRTSMQTHADLNVPFKCPAKKQKRSKSKVVTFDPEVWTAESYHAGLTAAKRRSVQKAFMDGRLRVVVATVAFGMGLDKANVRAVIHYNMAKSFESYVQEIGRAGRDGKLSHCHVFLDPDDKDLYELKRHTHSNAIDRVTLKKLLTRVFRQCRCEEIYSKGQLNSKSSEQSDVPLATRSNEDVEDEPQGSADRLSSTAGEYTNTDTPSVCGGHERAMTIEDTVQWLDIREEGISTLLCYLELHFQGLLENLNHVYASCSIKAYGGPRQLQGLAKKCPPVAVAIARQKLEGKTFSDCSQLDFRVIDICDSMGWDSGTVKRELKSLQWESGPNGFRKTGVMVELSDLAFHFRSRGNLTSEEMDSILDFLYSRTQRQEKAELGQLYMLSKALRDVSHKNYWMCSDEVDTERSDRLKTKLEEFFNSEERRWDNEGDGEYPGDANEPDSATLTQLKGDVRHFISLYGQDHVVTGRVIARIFHGISSPCFPAETWGRVRRFWRAHLDVDFNFVRKEATKIVMVMR